MISKYFVAEYADPLEDGMDTYVRLKKVDSDNNIIEGQDEEIYAYRPNLDTAGIAYEEYCEYDPEVGISSLQGLK